MAEAALLKDVKIKTAVVKRLVKEVHYYQKETEKEVSKLEQMKAQPDADEYVIKKQTEFLQESRQMIPNAVRRLESAVSDLKKVIVAGEGVLQGTAQLTDAHDQINVADSIVAGM